MSEGIHHIGTVGNMSSLVVQFLVVLVVLNVVSASSIDDAAREDIESERIIQGQVATPGQFPYVAALYFGDQFLCTSSILSPTTVLTAAHCVVFDSITPPAELFYAIANVSRGADSVRIDFATLAVHPDYTIGSTTLDNDVAVFTTIDSIPFSDEVGPVCISRPNANRMRYVHSTAIGWGRTRINSPDNPDRLHYGEQKIVSNPRCSVFSHAGIPLSDDKLCARGFGTSGICNGDSGGPLVHRGRRGRPVQIGIASYMVVRTIGGQRIPECSNIFAAVFTRVSSYYDFIMQNAGDSSICVA